MLRRLVLLTLLPLLLALVLPASVLAIDPALDPDIDEGHRLFAHEKYEGALEHYLKALKKNENDAELNYRTGMAYFCLMDFNSTIAYFEKAVAIDPDIEKKYVFKASGKVLSSTFLEGDRFIVDMMHYNYLDVARNDVVVFDITHSDNILRKYNPLPDKKAILLERIAGLPGDMLEILGRDVMINNKKIYSTALNSKYFFFEQNKKIIIPKNNFFIFDDDTGTVDSMLYGFLSGDNIVGKALLIYYSIGDEDGKKNVRKERSGLKIK